MVLMYIVSVQKRPASGFNTKIFKLNIAINNLFGACACDACLDIFDTHAAEWIDNLIATM